MAVRDRSPFHPTARAGAARGVARRAAPVALAVLAVLAAAPPLAAETAETGQTGQTGEGASPTLEELATAFGRLPAFRSAHLSPDGSRAVLVAQPEKIDLPVAIVHTFATGASEIVLASQEDEFDLYDCVFANDERVLCRFFGVGRSVGVQYGATRLVAVDADGSDMRVLMQRQLERKHEGKRAWDQLQDRIVDLLPDDPRHVLIEEPGERGHGLSRLDVSRGRLRTVQRDRANVWRWITDGSAEPRLRLMVTDRQMVWEHRKPGESRWEDLWRDRPGLEDDEFEPAGFGDDPNRLIAFRRIDGHRVLRAEDVVGDGEPVVLFSREGIDVAAVQELGPHRRVVAAHWDDERPHVDYFDPSLERVHALVARALEDKTVVIVDESWDRRTYLVFAYADVDPGTWYRLDMDEGRLAMIGPHRPALRDVRLSPMRPMTHVAADGVRVPGYVTVPVDAPKGPLPTVVLPHGGPESRDVWGFDWLAQFLAARGYVVLQTNYRGSFGYGDDWMGDGAYPEWRRVVSDIDSGLQKLIDDGVTDPKRVCALGWSFGGTVALLSVLERPDRYRCVVDIAGVSDPRDLIDEYESLLGKDRIKERISTDPDVLEQGSPRRRAGEIDVPVLIFHPEEDLNVDVEHGRKLARALRKAGKRVEYVEYEDDEHGIRSHASRIDMLTRIGRFLDEHLAPGAAGGAPEAPVLE